MLCSSCFLTIIKVYVQKSGRQFNLARSRHTHRRRPSHEKEKSTTADCGKFSKKKNPKNRARTAGKGGTGRGLELWSA
jgi:hypothetical protein